MVRVHVRRSVVVNYVGRKSRVSTSPMRRNVARTIIGDCGGIIGSDHRQTRDRAHGRQQVVDTRNKNCLVHRVLEPGVRENLAVQSAVDTNATTGGNSM